MVSEPSPTRSPAYDAFISYSHAADGKLAPALQGGLHELARPWHRMRALRVFRDQSSLSANTGLWSSIEAALSNSRFFVLLASPESAGSSWVRREIDFWRRERARENFLVAVTAGELVWDQAAGDFDWSRTTALPDNLRGYFDDEPLWVDLTWAREADQLSMRHSRFRDTVGTLAATIHGRPKDELDSEDVRQHRTFTRVRRIAVTAIGVLLVLAVVAGIVAWQQRNTAQRERNSAQRQARIATSQALAAQAQVLMPTQPSLAVNLALYAYELSPTFEARSAMAALVDANRPVHAHFTPGGEEVPEHRGAGVPAGNLVALSGDGRVLARYSVQEDNALRVFDVAGRTELGVLPSREVLSPRSSGLVMDRQGRRLVVYNYSRLEVWDVPSRTLLRTIETGPQLQSALVSPDGRWIAAAHGEGNNGPARLLLWNAETGAEVGEWQTSGYYPAMRFSGDSTTLLAISATDGSARTFDLTRGTWTGTRPFPRLANAFVFPDEAGRRAVVLDDEQLQVWDLTTQRRLVTRDAKDTAANGIDVSADGQTVVVGTLTGEVDTYNGNLEHVAEVNRYQHGVVTVSLAAGGDVVASTAEDGSVTVSVPTDRHRLVSDPGLLTVASMDGSTSLLGRGDTMELWDVAAHEMRAELPIEPPIITGSAAVDVTEDGSKAAVLTDGEVSLWDIATAERVGQVAIGAGSTLLRFLPDDRHLVAIAAGGRAVVVDTRDFTVTQHFDAASFATSADGRVLAVVSPDDAADSLVGLWRWNEAGTFDHIRTFPVPGLAGLARLAVDPSGQFVAVADADSRLFLARVDGSDEPRQLGGRLASVSTGIAFSGDGSVIVQDGNWSGRSSLLLWDVESGELLTHWPLTRSSSYSTDLTQVVSSGSTVFTVGQEGVTRWEVDLERWHDTLCAVASAELSEEERRRYLPDLEVPGPCRD